MDLSMRGDPAARGDPKKGLAEPPAAERVTVATVARFLFGSREAILMLANGRFVLPLALVLVFSAAIARQYDHVYLLKNPGFLVRPLVASFLLASFLYSILLVAFWRNLEPPRPGFRAYVTFLKLYWMTAPMAWLYAIPFERWMGVMDAAVANLWLASPFATIFGVEHEAAVNLPGGSDTRRYGDTAVTFYRL